MLVIERNYLDEALKAISEYGKSGMPQSKLWKDMGLRSRDGSRIIRRLLKGKYVRRERVLHDGRWTYVIIRIYNYYKSDMTSMYGIPCLSCDVESRCSPKGDDIITPMKCDILGKAIEKMYRKHMGQSEPATSYQTQPEVPSPKPKIIQHPVQTAPNVTTQPKPEIPNMKTPPVPETSASKGTKERAYLFPKNVVVDYGILKSITRLSKLDDDAIAEKFHIPAVIHGDARLIAWALPRYGNVVDTIVEIGSLSDEDVRRRLGVGKWKLRECKKVLSRYELFRYDSVKASH